MRKKKVTMFYLKFANWKEKWCKETISWDCISSMNSNSVIPEIDLTDLFSAKAKWKRNPTIWIILYEIFLMEEVNLHFMAVYIYICDTCNMAWPSEVTKFMFSSHQKLFSMLQFAITPNCEVITLSVLFPWSIRTPGWHFEQYKLITIAL